MEEKGFVSLWLAKVESAVQLKSFMREDYTEDGDYIPSRFASLFDIEYIDSGFSESEFIGIKSSLKDALKGASYDDIIIPKFERLLYNNDEIAISDFNSVVLLYNFKYEGNTIEAKSIDYFFKFIGFASF